LKILKQVQNDRYFIIKRLFPKSQPVSCPEVKVEVPENGMDTMTKRQNKTYGGI